MQSLRCALTIAMAIAVASCGGSPSAPSPTRVTISLQATAACSIPPSVRPFLWANNNGNGEFDRWWSNPQAITLAQGTHTLSVPLTAESWSSVNGKFGNADPPARFAFDRALLNVSRLGVTFGGGCSFGHGVNLSSGNAIFTLTGYSVR